MTERKIGPEQFRDLFKKPGQQQPQSSVRVAGKQGASTARSRPSSNSSNSGGVAGKRPGLPDKSSKSTKKISGKRHKQSGKKHSGSRNIGSSNSTPNKSEPMSDNESNRRTTGKSPAGAVARTPRTPTTPPVTANAGSRVRTPKDKKKKTPVVTVPAPPKVWNGQKVHEKTQYQATTVFENDTGGGATGGPTIQMAQARIKERPLQWKQEESSQPHTDTTKQSAETTGASKEDSKGSKEDSKPSKEDTKASKEDIKARDRTIFENDSDTPAPVKEAERVLQYAPGAAHESMSEPALRKKKSAERVRGVLSDRPPRETKPLRVIPSARTPPLRAPVRDNSPVAHTPPQARAAKSPSASPLRLTVSADATAAAAAFGSVEPSKEKSSSQQDEKERAVSCYLAPNMQSNRESSGSSGPSGSSEGQKGAAPDSEPYNY